MTAKQVVYQAANRGFASLLEITAVQEVDVLLAELDQRRAGLEAERTEVEQQITTIQSDIGARYLAGDAHAGAELPSLRARVEAISAASAHLARRRTVLQVDRQRAELIDIGRELDGLRAELGALEAATVPLLEQLSVLEGVEFDGSILLAQRVGQWTPDLAHNQPAGQFAHAELQAPDQVRPDIGGRYLAPKSRRLRAEIYMAELRAERIRQSLEPPATSSPRMTQPNPHAFGPDRHSVTAAPKIPTMTVTEKGVHLDQACRDEEAAAKERDRIARGLKMDSQDAVEAMRQATEDKRA